MSSDRDAAPDSPTEKEGDEREDLERGGGEGVVDVV